MNNETGFVTDDHIIGEYKKGDVIHLAKVIYNTATILCNNENVNLSNIENLRRKDELTNNNSICQACASILDKN
jgi:hypothetical protein